MSNLPTDKLSKFYTKNEICKIRPELERENEYVVNTVNGASGKSPFF